MSVVIWSLLLLLTMGLMASGSVRASDPHTGDSHHSRHWLISFTSNALGYSMILLPAAALVLFVKSKSCPPQSKSQFRFTSVIGQVYCCLQAVAISCCNLSLNCFSFCSCPSVRRCYLIRLFVFGKELHEHVDVEQQDVSDTEDDKLPACVSLHRTTNNAFDVNRVIVFTCCFVGLQVSYLLWGLLQEKIMTTNYTVTTSHPDSSAVVPIHSQSSFTPLPSHASQAAGSEIRTFQFHDSQFLVLVNRVLAFVVAVTVIIAKNRISGKRISYKKLSSLRSGKTYSIAPLHEFSFCSLSNILSSWCQYEALKYVNFPTQVGVLSPPSSCILFLACCMFILVHVICSTPTQLLTLLICQCFHYALLRFCRKHANCCP